MMRSEWVCGRLPVWIGLMAACAVAIMPSGASGVVVGQSDTFSGGIVGWTNGPGAADPANPAGGPGGAADNFMQVTSSGTTGAASRMNVFNRAQWLGNYVSAGVTSISMDLDNLGTTSLAIRIAFKSTTANGAPAYVTTVPFTLPVASGWQHAVFAIDASSMTPLASPATFNTFFSGAGPAEMRILSEAGGVPISSNGDVIAGALGVDNVTAVPEPAMMLILPAALLALRRRRV